MEKRLSLFKEGQTKLSSGLSSNFKIECDALTDDDWKCLAQIVSEHMLFSDVVSVPTGGDKFAKHLKEHVIDDEHYPVLICDDVLTTGASMQNKRNEVEGKTIGVVAFARGECPDWIGAVFQMGQTQLEPSHF